MHGMDGNGDFHYMLSMLCTNCNPCDIDLLPASKKPVQQCPLTTADGSKINLHHLKAGRVKWCAVSRDLLWLFPKGKPKKVFIEGYGIYLVKDVMNKRHHHRVDILIHPKDTKRISISNVKVKIL